MRYQNMSRLEGLNISLNDTYWLSSAQESLSDSFGLKRGIRADDDGGIRFTQHE